MNLSILDVVLFGTGALLVYSAVKGVDPRDVVKSSLGGKNAQAPAAKYSTAPTVAVTPQYGYPTTDPVPPIVGV